MRYVSQSLGMLLTVTILAGCGSGDSGSNDSGNNSSPDVNPPSPVDVTITIDNRASALAAAPFINRRLLGSNVQWTGGCDGLLNASDTTFAVQPLATALALAPTVIRFPGGGLADTYQWQNGMGPIAGRGTCLNIFFNTAEKVYFGTDEFLSLCQQTGAKPLITLNLITAVSTDSAAWVTQVNGNPAATISPVVRDWEMGNEPYLENSAHPTYNRTALQYASSYNEHVVAMLAADSRIRVGLPLMGPITASLVSIARQNWNADVLGAITQRVDFVAVHNAYLPFLYTNAGIPSDTDMLRSTLAAAPAVITDLTTLRAELTQHGISAPFALTEHNALMTVFGTYSPIPRSDGIPASVAGAIYTADLLCLLAGRDDVESAEHWSLINNWMFGAMDSTGHLRPSGHALQELGQVFIGQRLAVVTASPTADVLAFGALPAQTNVPLVNALVTKSNSTMRVMLVNRSPDRALSLRLVWQFGVPPSTAATVRTLTETDPLQNWSDAIGAPDWTQQISTTDVHGLLVTLPAHSLVSVTLNAPSAPVAIPAGIGSHPHHADSPLATK